MANGRPELGGRIAPSRRYQNDVWHIAQQMAAMGIPTLGTRDTGFKNVNIRDRKRPSDRVPDRHAVKAHPAAFPVELPRAVMMFLSGEGELVVDPFVGVGTTIIAAERMGRLAYGIDIDPIYCELTMRRWEAETGKQAERERGR